MPYSEELAERVRQATLRRKGISEKKMFGGVGFFCEGHLFIGIMKEALLVRLAVEQAAYALREPHVKVFDLTGRVMKGWVVIAAEALADDARLKDWIRQSLAFVKSLPSK